MRLSQYLALAVASLPFVLIACGNDKPNRGPVAAPAATSAAASIAPAPTKTGPEYAESDFVENDRNRDPFRTFSELFAEAEKKPMKLQRKVILSQYSLDELKLAAIVRGSDYPRAMVIPPGGKGSVIKRGDFVGRAETVHTGGTNGTDYQVNWRVDRVRDGDVVLVREDPAQPNIPPATRVIPLHPEADKNAAADQDLLGDQQLAP
ncbi:MAG: pilus assembly protein PilP [Polyangiaceae bacterium]|jgi:type IV pilus assembly protein PilP